MQTKSMQRVLLLTTALLLPFAAQAAMNDNGVYVPAPGQEHSLGTMPVTGYTATERQRTIPVEGAGTATVIERSTTYYPAGTMQPAPAAAYVPAQPAPADYNAYAPATSGEPNPARTAVNDELLQEQQIGDVRFVTGGVGEAERQAMERLRPNYNLRVLNAEKGGAFIGDAVVSITDTKGNELLSTQTDPLFLAQLPAGRYTVKAERNGVVKTQTVAVAKGKASQVSFSW